MIDNWSREKRYRVKLEALQMVGRIITHRFERPLLGLEEVGRLAQNEGRCLLWSQSLGLYFQD